ncbi:MAG: hypothetical protein J5I59_10745 [Saprospiraceae bacterium]|nr:hypothetical protein [Saprospiraceae bacterium]
MKQILLAVFLYLSFSCQGQKWQHRIYAGLNLGTLTQIAFEKQIYSNPYPNQDYMGMLLGGQLGYEIEYRLSPPISLSSGLTFFNFGKNTKLYDFAPFPTVHIIREKTWMINLGCPIILNYYPFKNDKVSISGGYVLSKALGAINGIGSKDGKNWVYPLYYDRGLHHSAYLGLNFKIAQQWSASIFWLQSIGKYLEDQGSYTWVPDYQGKLYQYDMSYRSTNFGLNIKYTLR